jgi:hypothetical protein
MFMFDVETLGTEDKSVILSAGIIYFDPETDGTTSLEELINRGLFVKFDVKEQIQKYKRTVDQSTMDWWKKQTEETKVMSFRPSADDVEAYEGLKQIILYIDKHKNEKSWDLEFMWARGGLDERVISSLAKQVDLLPIAPYHRWRDIRTAIDLVYGSINGYVEVEGVEKGTVGKHDPVIDCAFDILMLLNGKKK